MAPLVYRRRRRAELVPANSTRKLDSDMRRCCPGVRLRGHVRGPAAAGGAHVALTRIRLWRAVHRRGSGAQEDLLAPAPSQGEARARVGRFFLAPGRLATEQAVWDTKPGPVPFGVEQGL